MRPACAVPPADERKGRVFMIFRFIYGKFLQKREKKSNFPLRPRKPFCSMSNQENIII